LKILSAPADETLRLKLLAKLPEGRLMPRAGKALDDFFACIAAGDMLVSPDTSAVHAACAFDIPVLGLYPEPYWNFISWRPLGKNNHAIRSPKEGVDSISAGQGIKAAVKMLKNIIKKA
jgi:ADP-heptose:LPS heptosyltransferase